ncbi:hypothetical protein BKA70DRAFT_1427514 [Coprinopsis sp. MPI-PUGE-AT-0042]|nr:hypothetical protein BKA70DRAFT_1427514 [Coprinopsis sp. MPI-PUGE-AT-0042]
MPAISTTFQKVKRKSPLYPKPPRPKYTCEDCEYNGHSGHLKRHARSVHKMMKDIECPLLCGYRGSRMDNVKQHALKTCPYHHLYNPEIHVIKNPNATAKGKKGGKRANSKTLEEPASNPHVAFAPSEYTSPAPSFDSPHRMEYTWQEPLYGTLDSSQHSSPSLYTPSLSPSGSSPPNSHFPESPSSPNAVPDESLSPCSENEQAPPAIVDATASRFEYTSPTGPLPDDMKDLPQSWTILEHPIGVPLPYRSPGERTYGSTITFESNLFATDSAKRVRSYDTETTPIAIRTRTTPLVGETELSGPIPDPILLDGLSTGEWWSRLMGWY